MRTIRHLVCTYGGFIILSSLIACSAFATISLPPEPPSPQIPTNAELLASAPALPLNIALPDAWIFELNTSLKPDAARALIAQFNQKGVPAFMTPLSASDSSSLVKVSIGPEIDLTRLNLLETRVNIDSKLGTVRRFQPDPSTELSS
jgi:cell division septation protein DedD